MRKRSNYPKEFKARVGFEALKDVVLLGKRMR